MLCAFGLFPFMCSLFVRRASGADVYDSVSRAPRAVPQNTLAPGRTRRCTSAPGQHAASGARVVLEQVMSEHMLDVVIKDEEANVFRPPEPGAESRWAAHLPFPLAAVLCESDAGLATAGQAREVGR